MPNEERERRFGPEGPAITERDEPLFRKLGEANLVGVGFGDFNGVVTYVNDEMLRMMGRSRADFARGTLSWKSCIAPEDQEAARLAGERLLREGVAREYELSFVKPDGTRTRYMGAAALVRPEDGFHVSIAVDVTAQRQAEEALKAADARKNEALAIVAHEIRNPLAALRGAIDVMEMALAQGAPVPVTAEQLAAMGRQITQIARLASDLLDVTKIARGELEFEARPLDLVALARSAALDAQPSFAECGVALVIDLPADAIDVAGDAERLRQALANLLDNARKFSSAGAKVTLSLRADAESAVVGIRDEGIGIEADALPAAFEPFRRGTHGQRAGVGLGLSIVRGIVAQHGGSVRLASAGLGRGTEAIVTLPRVR